jgi:hypothetical protein
MFDRLLITYHVSKISDHILMLFNELFFYRCQSTSVVFDWYKSLVESNQMADDYHLSLECRSLERKNTQKKTRREISMLHRLKNRSIDH